MKLTKNQTEFLLSKLHTLWKPQTCPICSNVDWKIPESILELREYEEGDLVVYSKDSAIVPLVSVTCTRCGYTFLLNTITLGLMDDKLTNNE